MSNQPCRFLALPKHFGRRPDASFPDATTPLERAQVRAAQVQHTVALSTRDALDARGESLDWLANELGEHVDHLRRKLHGKAIASLTDLTAWAEVLSLPANELEFSAQASS
jgi:hypothetical protein